MFYVDSPGYRLTFYRSYRRAVEAANALYLSASYVRVNLTK